MTTFHYIAEDSTGKKSRGIIDCSGSDTAIRAIRMKVRGGPSEHIQMDKPDNTFLWFLALVPFFFLATAYLFVVYPLDLPYIANLLYGGVGRRFGLTVGIWIGVMNGILCDLDGEVLSKIGKKIGGENIGVRLPAIAMAFFVPVYLLIRGRPTLNNGRRDYRPYVLWWIGLVACILTFMISDWMMVSELSSILSIWRINPTKIGMETTNIGSIIWWGVGIVALFVIPLLISLITEQGHFNSYNSCWNMVDIPGKDYKMGEYEVTQNLWTAVMGGNPSKFKGFDNPVENVSWHDCQEFIKKLNAMPEVKSSGLRYRLPTEAEWEYACRAGSTGDYCKLADGTEITSSNLGEVAWCCDNNDGKTHHVGMKKPNAFGLYDMHGNVSEWCEGLQAGSSLRRVNRGGGWNSDAGSCTASYRSDDYPDSRRACLGFRLAATQNVNR